jgi:hypothetical protein
MNNLFEISNEERRRILNLHESATKNLYLVKEQQTVKPIKQFNITNSFPSGQFNLTDTTQIDDAITEINAIAAKNTNILYDIVVNSSESKVPNRGVGLKPGDLSLKRGLVAEQYIKDKMGDKMSVKVNNLGAQGPEWDATKGNNNPDYLKYQYVTINLVISDGGQTSKFCKLKLKGRGTVADPSTGFIARNEDFDISKISEGKTLRVVLLPEFVPDLLVVTVGSQVESTGFVGINKPEYVSALATILGNQYLLKGSQIPSMFPSDIEPMTTQEATSIFQNRTLLEQYLKHVINNVDWKLPLRQIIPMIKFYKYKTSPVKSAKGIIRIKKPANENNLNIKVYSPIGTTIWSLIGSCG